MVRFCSFSSFFFSLFVPGCDLFVVRLDVCDCYVRSRTGFDGMLLAEVHPTAIARRGRHKASALLGPKPDPKQDHV
jgi:hypothetical protein